MAAMHATAVGAELVQSVPINAPANSLIYCQEVAALTEKDVCLVIAQCEITSTLGYNLDVCRYLCWAKTQAELLSAPNYVGPAYPAGADDITPEILRDGQDHQTSNLFGAISGLTGTVFFGLIYYANTSDVIAIGDAMQVNQSYGGLSVVVL